MKRVLYDTDVILDVLLNRQPHYEASATALDAISCGQVEGYVAGHAVTNLFYILRRQIGSASARATLGTLLSRMKVAPVTDAVIRNALTAAFSDFEDAVTYCSAVEAGVVTIVTRNVADFASATLPVVLPDALQVT